MQFVIERNLLNEIPTAEIVIVMKKIIKIDLYHGMVLKWTTFG